MVWRKSWTRTLLIRAVCLLGIIKVTMMLADWLLQDKSLKNVHPYDNVRKFDDLLYNIFLDEFTGGAVSAAYQTQKNWNADGMLDETVDQLCKDGNIHISGVSLELRESLGLAFHRIPLEWSRILPDGTTSTINQLGIDYYLALIDTEKEHGHRPLVVLQGSDLPKALLDIGGWSNDKLVQYFVEYAGLAFDEFGDKVTFWLTFDEPWSIPWQKYTPEAVRDPNYGPKAVSNLLKAHAEVFHLYDNEFRPTQDGLIGIGLNGRWIAENATSDAEFVDSLKFEIGWYCNPLLNLSVANQEDDNDEMLKTYSQTLMPALLEEKADKFKNTYDFFGLNYHMADTCKAHVSDDCGTTLCWQQSDNTNQAIPTGEACWLRVAPWGLWRLLVWVKDYYDPSMPFYIIQKEETGYHSNNETQESHAGEL